MSILDLGPRDLWKSLNAAMVHYKEGMHKLV
jgi:hypothetical protein